MMTTASNMESVTVENPKLSLNVLVCDENKKLFGILLQNQQVFEEARVNVQWLEYEEMMSIDAPSVQTVKEVFVIPKFEDNPLFDYLQSLNHFVWSTFVIEYCVRYIDPLPTSKRILYSLAFDGSIVVLSSGLNAQQYEMAKARIKLMGGKVSTEFSPEASLLIVKDCESTNEYRKFICAGKPICGLRAIDQLWEVGIKHISEFVNANRNEFYVRLFDGCVITISGVEIVERSQLACVIEENGGKYSADMEKGICTHLVTDQSNTSKYRYAMKWGIKIVTVSWLNECLECKMRLPEVHYHPTLPFSKSAI